MSNPAMYIFLNKGLNMSTGKAAAQASHAAVEAYRLTYQLDLMKKQNTLKEWYLGGHYKKLVMQARDENHIRTIRDYLEARGFQCTMIIDEGMTEIQPHQVTALGVQIVDKDDAHTAATFSTFELYKDDMPSTATEAYQNEQSKRPRYLRRSGGNFYWN